MIAIIGVTLTLALLLITQALKEQITFFKTPTDIVTKGLDPAERVRIGGLVKEGSVTRNGKKVDFIVTDTAHDLNVYYEGILPDLFREGQGIVAEGQLNTNGVFVADTVLAKHDENYVPKEVAAALKEQGVWKGGAWSGADNENYQGRDSGS